MSWPLTVGPPAGGCCGSGLKHPEKVGHHLMTSASGVRLHLPLKVVEEGTTCVFINVFSYVSLLIHTMKLNACVTSLISGGGATGSNASRY